MDRKVRMSASRVILQFSGVSVRRRSYSDISLCKQENKKEERSSSPRKRLCSYRWASQRPAVSVPLRVLLDTFLGFKSFPCHRHVILF